MLYNMLKAFVYYTMLSNIVFECNRKLYLNVQTCIILCRCK